MPLPTRLFLFAHPQVTKKVSSPLPTTDSIFYAGTGMLLCRSEDKVRMHATRRTAQAFWAVLPCLASTLLGQAGRYRAMRC